MTHPAIPKPSELHSQRDLRFDGSGYELFREAFATSDLALIEATHKNAQALYREYLAMRDALVYERLEPYIAYFARDELRESLLRFGKASTERYREQGRDEDDILQLRRIVHDLRGGAMTALLGNAQLAVTGELEPDIVLDMVMLARDQAKMMRSVIVDLDPDTREAEERFRRHTIVDIVERWQKRHYRSDEQSVSVVVESDYQGDISTRCLERSSLDRVIYNHVNNAVEHAASDEVTLTITSGQDLVRFTVSNALSPDDREFLAPYAEDNFAALYKEGFTRSGNGLGLSVCAELVGASVGMLPGTALEQSYLGALIHDGRYHAWFHWPRYDDHTASADDTPSHPND